MECRFFVEAKAFFFSVKDGMLELRLEERRKAFAGVVCLGSQCAAWLVATVTEVLKTAGAEDFVKSFRADEKALFVRGVGNKADQYLEVAICYGWSESIWLSRGCERRG